MHSAFEKGVGVARTQLIEEIDFKAWGLRRDAKERSSLFPSLRCALFY